MKNLSTKNRFDSALWKAIPIIFLTCSMFAAAAFAQNTPQRQNGKIAYATDDTYSNIYTVNPDGSGNTDISSFPNGDRPG